MPRQVDRNEQEKVVTAALRPLLVSLLRGINREGDNDGTLDLLETLATLGVPTDQTRGIVIQYALIGMQDELLAARQDCDAAERQAVQIAATALGYAAEVLARDRATAKSRTNQWGRFWRRLREFKAT
jgi:hypothetical protein